MTNEEAILNIDMALSEIEWKYPMDYAAAFKMAIEALEKQIPKKPLAFWDVNESLIECPICKCPIDISEAEWSRQFCGKCGQRLEWE